MFGSRREPAPTEAVADPRVKLREVRRRARRLSAALTETRDQLAQTRKELAAARREAELLRRTVDGTTDELGRLRDFTLDVFPEVELADAVEEVCRRVIADRLTYLHAPHLRSLASCMVEAELRGRPGLVVETGTALGGSAIVLAAAKHPDRPMRVYDVFGTIPPPSDHDSERETARYADIAAGRSAGVGGDVYYGYREDLVGEVTASFSRLGVPVEETRVELVQGLFEDTIDLDEPVALAHLDGDWYESTLVCLERIAPLVVPGGRLVIDDYHNWSGCRRAVDEYFAGRREYRLELRAKVHAVRVS